MREIRPSWIALGASLLLHGMLVGGLSWTLPEGPQAPEPAVFDARLVAPPPPPPPPPPRASRVAKAVEAPRPVAPPPEEPAAPVTEAMPAAASAAPRVVAEAPAPAASVAASVAHLDPAPMPSPLPAAAPAAAPPPLNALPPRLDLRFDVHYGIASGEQTLVWVNEGERYTLTSVASATGFAGLFYRGRFAQTSRGRITPHGLAPEEFWDQRGSKRSSARFDADHRQITLVRDDGVPRHFDYEGRVQDALSLFFQFALTAPPPDARTTYRVFTGKKLRDYTYEVRGEVPLETALGTLRTLHVARADVDDGRFEAWLAVDRHFLPVRVLKTDDKGNAMELTVRSIAP